MKTNRKFPKELRDAYAQAQCTPQLEAILRNDECARECCKLLKELSTTEENSDCISSIVGFFDFAADIHHKQPYGAELSIEGANKTFFAPSALNSLLATANSTAKKMLAHIPQLAPSIQEFMAIPECLELRDLLEKFVSATQKAQEEAARPNDPAKPRLNVTPNAGKNSGRNWLLRELANGSAAFFKRHPEGLARALAEALLACEPIAETTARDAMGPKTHLSQETADKNANNLAAWKIENKYLSET